MEASLLQVYLRQRPDPTIPAVIAIPRSRRQTSSFPLPPSTSPSAIQRDAHDQIQAVRLQETEIGRPPFNGIRESAT